MSCYRRPIRPGATIFFTVCLARPGTGLLVEEVALLRAAVRTTRARRPFGIDAWVVLPDHLHAIWTLPEADANFSDRWGAIKARFSRLVRAKAALRPAATERQVGCKPTLQRMERIADGRSEAERLRALRSKSKRDKQDAGIWQRRFWEHHIRNDADLAVHLRYCWADPVRHGLVPRAADWPYSSIHRDIHDGVTEAVDWGHSTTAAFGETA